MHVREYKINLLKSFVPIILNNINKILSVSKYLNVNQNYIYIIWVFSSCSATEIMIIILIPLVYYF